MNISKKKIIVSTLTLIVLFILSYILIKLFYPTYINYRFDNVFIDNNKELISLYNTKEISDYLEIIKLEKSNTAKPFLKEKIKNFYNNYPFILWWKKILIWMKKIDLSNFTDKEIFKFSNKLVNNYKILKQTRYSKTYQWISIYKLRKSNFCILKNLDKDFLVKYKIWKEKLLKDIATLSTYNKIFWDFLWKKDICLKYVSHNSFIIYINNK